MPVVLFKTTVSEKLSSSVSSPTRLIHSAIVCLKKVIKVFDLFSMSHSKEHIKINLLMMHSRILSTKKMFNMSFEFES